MRTLISLAAAAALGLVAAPASASTIGCRDWLRLGDDQKMAAIDGMVADLLGSSGKVRQYDVHRGALGRCLSENAVQMSYEFDDVCSDSRTADMQAIQRVFKSYVWSCS
jgi:hypothetical protein